MRARTVLSPSTMFWLLGVGAVTVMVPGEANALDPFVNDTALLNNAQLTSGVPMAIGDVNADGYDDIVRLSNTLSLEIEYQQPDGTFVHLDWGPIGGGAWGMALGDVNADGMLDIFAGGFNDGLKILTADATGMDFTNSQIQGPGTTIFTQCAAFSDIDNNQTLDLFVCHDNGLSSPFTNDGTGTFTHDLGLINPMSAGGNPDPGEINSGNYGIIWIDYDRDQDVDMYISKCRLGIVSPTDPRRMNILYENNGDGTFTEVAADRGLRPFGQSWAADFGDIDNDGDFDAIVINHDIPSVIYENDGTNNFTDITASTGATAALAAGQEGIQVKFEDFDNDGYIDILHTASFGGDHTLLFNNGDGTFTEDPAAFDTGGDSIQSAVVGDLNSDGFPDVMAGFANGYNSPSNSPDQLYMNPGNENHYINVRLHGVESNLSAVGAVVELNGPWGTQLRSIRAGEGYGINHSMTLHFGIGQAEAIDSMVIYWPAGGTDTAMNPPIDVTVDITEGCPDTWFEDADGDGFGDPGSEAPGCLPPEGFVDDNTDCADDDMNNFPGNEEVCDGLDNNCDGTADEGLDDCGAGGSTGGSTGDADGSGSASASGDDTSTTPPPTTDPTDASAGSDGSDGGAADDDGGGGCGCDVSEPNRGAWWMLSLFGLVALRRRRQ